MDIKAKRLRQCLADDEMTCVSEEFVLDVLDESQSNVSWYEKLLFVWKFCQVK